MRQLGHHSNFSKAKLQTIIDHGLKRNPKINGQFLTNGKHLLLDATFLHRPVSIVAIMDAQTRKIICGQHGVRESSPHEMFAFLSRLQLEELQPKSFTVDGNGPTMRVLEKLWPEAVIQRCLVHVQRQGLMWCRIRPKRIDAKKLRKIFLKLPHIKSYAQAQIWRQELKTWEKNYGTKIKNQPGHGRVFSDLKRARSLLIKALPNLFHYLKNSKIPNSTNLLEGYFSRLKAKYRNHRGLAIKKRFNYFKWFFFLHPK